MWRFGIPVLIILTLLPLAACAVSALLLPETVPLHINIQGEIDRWGSKWELLVIMSVTSVVCNALCTFCYVFAPKLKAGAFECAGRQRRPGASDPSFVAPQCFATIYRIIMFTASHWGRYNGTHVTPAAASCSPALRCAFAARRAYRRWRLIAQHRLSLRKVNKRPDVNVLALMEDAVDDLPIVIPIENRIPICEHGAERSSLQKTPAPAASPPRARGAARFEAVRSRPMCDRRSSEPFPTKKGARLP